MSALQNRSMPKPLIVQSVPTDSSDPHSLRNLTPEEIERRVSAGIERRLKAVYGNDWEKVVNGSERRRYRPTSDSAGHYRHYLPWPETVSIRDVRQAVEDKRRLYGLGSTRAQLFLYDYSI